MLAEDPEVDQVVICTPDKDLGQCVRGDGRVVQLDRRKTLVLDEAAIVTKFGVFPESIPDYLGLVGDSSDGFPGLPGWGAKSAAAVLARYRHLEHIPADGREWDVKVGRPTGLASTLQDQWKDALLFRDLATLRIDRSLVSGPAQLEWHGPTDSFSDLCRRIEGDNLPERAAKLSAKRARNRLHFDATIGGHGSLPSSGSSGILQDEGGPVNGKSRLGCSSRAPNP